MFLKVLVFAFGIGAFQQLSQLPDNQIFIVVLLIGLLLGWQKQWLLCIAFAGWLWGGLFAVWHLSHNQLPTALEGQDITVQGVISSIPHADERKTRFDFKLTENLQNLPEKLKLSWYYPKQPLSAGQHWSFKVKLKRPHGLMNPGGFDYERWLFTQGVGATGYIRHPEQAQLWGQDSAWQNINVLRQQIASRICRMQSLQYSAFIKALTIGSTDDIPRKHNGRFYVKRARYI